MAKETADDGGEQECTAHNEVLGGSGNTKRRAVTNENTFKKNKEGQIPVSDAAARSAVYASVPISSDGRTDHSVQRLLPAKRNLEKRLGRNGKLHLYFYTEPGFLSDCKKHPGDQSA